MGQQYLSEIRIMAFNFAPRGWALCNGQVMSITQNQALFSLIGTTYGGDGIHNFALPNLQSRVPLSMGTTNADIYKLGQAAGEANHTLQVAEMGTHNHFMNAYAGTANADATGVTPGNTAVLAQGLVSQGGGTTSANLYGSGSTSVVMAPTAIGNTGSSQGHPNQQPYLVLNFCIALTGIFPSQN